MCILLRRCGLGDMMNAPYDVEAGAVDTMITCAKVSVPNFLAPVLDALLLRVREDSLPRMLHLRECSSTKYYREIPSVVAKALINKYQGDLKCKSAKHPVIPICGDKGKQIKLEGAGIRIPALFKKAVLPIAFPKPIVGFVRSVEFFTRRGKWYMSVYYNTPVKPMMDVIDCIGVDRNSKGNMAVLADPQNGKVLHLG